MSIAWSREFPLWEKIWGYRRLRAVRARFFEHYAFRPSQGWPFVKRDPGYHGKIASLWNKHQGRRGFIIGNGPSLSQMDLSPLKNEITIGSNGIFLKFEEMGFHTTYFTMEDPKQIEDRRRQLEAVKGPLKLYGVHNAYAFKPDEDTLFMNVEYESHPLNERWRDFYPGFSTDIASVVYLGTTITYINLQLAFFLGLNPVYIIGCDHSYGPIAEKFPPGKIEITPEVFDLLKQAHFIDSYHKIGGTFGVPYVKEQEKAYARALEMFHASGREIYNAGVNSKLDIFPRTDFHSLFNPAPENERRADADRA